MYLCIINLGHNKLVPVLLYDIFVLYFGIKSRWFGMKICFTFLTEKKNCFGPIIDLFIQSLSTNYRDSIQNTKYQNIVLKDLNKFNISQNATKLWALPVICRSDDFFKRVLQTFKFIVNDWSSCPSIMAIRIVEFSNGGYKIRLEKKMRIIDF